MKIEKDKVVELTYELTVDGAVADKATEEAPLSYIHGTHMLLPKFEAAVEGLEEGGAFSFTLTPEEGYGEYDPARVISIPKENFAIDGVIREDLLVPGQIIPMLDGTGHVVQGIVKVVGSDSVSMDFNHSMAGKVLNFTGKVVSIKEFGAFVELEKGILGVGVDSALDTLGQFHPHVADSGGPVQHMHANARFANGHEVVTEGPLGLHLHGNGSGRVEGVVGHALNVVAAHYLGTVSL